MLKHDIKYLYLIKNSKMKKIRHFLVAVVTLLAATATMAQNGFNYQAVIRDDNGNKKRQS